MFGPPWTKVKSVARGIRFLKKLSRAGGPPAAGGHRPGQFRDLARLLLGSRNLEERRALARYVLQRRQHPRVAERTIMQGERAIRPIVQGARVISTLGAVGQRAETIALT
jgi:hypothetical protein